LYVPSLIRWRWPRSAREAKVHAVLMAAVLWVALAVFFAAGRGPRSVVGPLKGADFVQFYTSGFLVRTHQTARLYNVDALHRAQVALVPESDPELYPPVYPPHTALLFMPFSVFSFSQATLLWSLITISVFAIIVRSAWRPVADYLHDRWFVCAAAAAFPPFWSLVLHGQATILVLAAFWAAWLALERHRRFVAGMALGLLLIKPQCAIPLVVLVVACGEWAMLAGAVTSIAMQVGAVLALLGWPVVKAYGAFLPIIVQAADLLEPKPFQSHSLRALTRLAPTWIGLPLWGVLSAVVLVFTIRVWKSGAPLRVRFGMVILASVLVNPHLIVYDATVLALPLIWFSAYVLERNRPLSVATFWASVYWLFVAFLAPSAAAVGVQISVLLMMWLLAVIVRTVAHDDRSRQPEPSLGVGFEASGSLAVS